MNEYQQEYNYFNILLDISNKSQFYSYNLSDFLYKIYYRGNGNNNLTPFYISEPLHLVNCVRARPNIPVFYLNDYDNMNLIIDAEHCGADTLFNDNKRLLQQLFKVLVKIDNNISFINIKSNGCMVNRPSNCAKSSFIRIGNNVSEIEFEYSVPHTAITSDSKIHRGINVIFKSKIIDMNLLYYLLYADVNLIQVSNNISYYTLKNTIHNLRFSRLEQTSIALNASSNRYRIIHPTLCSIIDCPIDFVASCIVLINTDSATPKNKCQNISNSQLKQEIEMMNKSRVELLNRINVLESQIASLIIKNRNFNLLKLNSPKSPKKPKVIDVDKVDKKLKDAKEKTQFNENENENKNENDNTDKILPSINE